jgi:DNA-binding response OmpR family regulator
MRSRLDLVWLKFHLMEDVVSVATLPNYSFGRFLLDHRRGTLLAGGEKIFLRAKSFALLRHFVENAERIIDRDEIMRSVWPGVFVGDDNIAGYVANSSGGRDRVVHQGLLYAASE